MDNCITSKNLKTFFPRSFPKDIVNIIDDYLFEIIREEAKKLYLEVVDWMISHVLVPEKYFIKKIVPYFVKNVGWSFQDFLKIHHGNDFIKSDSLISARWRIKYFILPEYGLSSQDKEDMEHFISIFLEKVLTRMAYDEGYLENDTVADLKSYLESLQN